MTDDIDTEAIVLLRQRDLALRAELKDVDAQLVALGINPHLEPLIVAILNAAACPLSEQRLWNCTRHLKLHSRSWRDYISHLDRLHADGKIVPVATGGWTVPRPSQATL